MKWLIWSGVVYAVARFIALPYRWLNYRRMMVICGGEEGFSAAEREETWRRY